MVSMLLFDAIYYKTLIIVAQTIMKATICLHFFLKPPTKLFPICNNKTFHI